MRGGNHRPTLRPVDTESVGLASVAIPKTGDMRSGRSFRPGVPSFANLLRTTDGERRGDLGGMGGAPP
ncbi:hypothetical protein ES703_32508 [subsurface metagenome]